ncbi:SPOR domain-containing protein [Colwelliaceae bacterium 6441]
MSSLAQALENPEQSESVTTISATARVDYILRFSKQAVMVVDEQITLCSSIGSQFLSNLSAEQNAAYITMSAKLNDLQVRCRIIEQLFGNTLFDPEQSVAVSLINLVKKHKQAISIVIDNAHLLSLQLTHELCQLAEIAKKSDHQINVLLLSTPQGGFKVSQNQSLFQKKLAIISAETGQLISHNAKLFKPQQNYLAFTPMKKWGIFFLLLAIVLAGSVYFLFQRDSFGFSEALSQLDKTQAIKSKITNVAPDTFVIDSETLSVNVSDVIKQATVSDIFTSLTQVNETSQKTMSTIYEKAEPLDIVNAISAFSVQENPVNEQNSKSTETAEQPPEILTNDKKESVAVEEIEPTAPVQEVVSTNPKTTELAANAIPLRGSKALLEDVSVSQIEEQIIADAAYQKQKEGFVIQIAGFTQQAVLDEFLIDFNQINFYQYQRIVNDEKMTILTTQHYATRQLAEQAFSELPQEIQARSPWIKAISAINDEINHFQRSQSIKNQVTIPAS